MDKTSAAAIVDTVVNHFAPRINESIRELMMTGPSGTQLNSYRRAAGRVLGYLYTDLLRQIFAQYPDLEPSAMMNDDNVGEPPLDPSVAAGIGKLVDDLDLWLKDLSSAERIAFAEGIEEVEVGIYDIRSFLTKGTP